VQRGAPGTFVYVAKPDDTVAVQTIKLGPADGTNVAITSGLTAGEKVVIDGADKLRDKAKIVLRQETAPAAPGTTAPAAQESPRRSAPAP
jgi:multidrug efflux system membrane fusion protein